MANVEFRYAPGQTTRYLDVSPMISALRFQPGDFEYAHGWLHHVPSRHRFQFDRLGRVTIDAMCGCASMAIKPEQTDELVTMFKTWRQHYWQPLETNREFDFALPQAERLRPAVSGRADGLPAVPSPRATGHRPCRRLGGVSDACRIAGPFDPGLGRAARPSGGAASSCNRPAGSRRASRLLAATG